MPGSSHYAGLRISEALIELAEHHISQEARHISAFECSLLVQAAEIIRRFGPIEDTELQLDLPLNQDGSPSE